jgi:hypothetical protein
MRPDLGSAAHARMTSEHAEGMDGGVGLELHARLDPGRAGIADADTGQHVRPVYPIAQDGRGGRHLGSRVDSLSLDWILCDARADGLVLGDEEANRVGEVELALGVGRLELLQRRPKLLGLEDVDGRVDLAHSELFGRGIGGFDDRAHATFLISKHASVAANILGAEGEHGSRGFLLPVCLDELAQQRGGE